MNYTSENENERISYSIGASMTGSIIKSMHGKLSIWESIRYTHARSYQKSAIKLVIKHFKQKRSNQNIRLLLLFYNKKIPML